jgi:hypothetical protein
MSSYEERRQKQIAKNRALFDELKLQHAGDALQGPRAKPHAVNPPAKRRKIESARAHPQRSSARIAGAEVKPVYIDEKITFSERVTRPSKKQTAPRSLPTPPADNPKRSQQELERLREQWSAWKPAAGPPTRDENGAYHFDSDVDFTPNKSPSEMMREGCFGGTYWRPLYSKALGVSIQDDWKELPEEWISGLKIEKFLTSMEYDPEVNKFGVSSGQTIEEWEAAGWINHEYDVRGWFQWYCRYFLGRRCDDDERQISRWKKCVGETGRWRRILLKKYQAAGIRTVADEGEDDVEGVSPVIHQTCHHWAFEIRQDVLDAWWNG